MDANVDIAHENTVNTHDAAPGKDDTERKRQRDERAVIRDVRRLLAQGYTRDARLGYAIGARIKSLKSEEGKYGKGSVEHVADEVGCTAALLYNFAKVADAWTDEEFEAELAKPSEGLPLTLSHYAVVARLKDVAQHPTFLERARCELLPVRELAQLIRAANRKPGAPSRGRPVLSLLVTASARMLERTKADFESLKTVNVTDDSADQLQLALETYTAMRVAAEQVESRLAELLVQAKKQEPAADEVRPSSNDAPGSEPEPTASVASRPEIGAMHRYIAR